MIAEARAVASVPDALTSVEAAPLLCAGITTYNALRNAGLRGGDLVVVQGIGGLVSRFRSSYAHFTCVSSVRRQKRSMDARMSSADFVQRNGLGAAFLILI